MSEVVDLFPPPLYRNNIDRPCTDDEFSTLDEIQKGSECHDSYVLNNHPDSLSCIRAFIQENIDDYLRTVMSPMDDVSLYISQSWCVFMKKGDTHEYHVHPNSIVSGVFYIRATHGTLMLYNTYQYQTIRTQPKNNTVYNSDSISIGVRAGDIVLFPSHVPHSVPETFEDETRISLAFNTFFVGDLNSGELAKLRLGHVDQRG